MLKSFFKKKKNIKLNDILKVLKIKTQTNNYSVNDIKPLESSGKNDVTFFHSNKYLDSVKNTKSKLIITNKKFKNILPHKFNIIEVENVLLSVYKITALFYPKALDDNYDSNVQIINNKKYFNLKSGKNILIGKNVKIGKNCSIGHNSIIETNVEIGNNCNIGNNVILKNTIIGNNTNILDGAIIGKKGFGFYPGNKKKY